MAAIKNVLVTGASGNVGVPVSEALYAAGFNVTALTRASSKATFPSGYKVAKIADSYPHAELVEVLRGQDAVISTLKEVDDQKRLVDAAIEAGVRRIVPSEFGCDTTNPRALDLVPLFQEKQKVIEYLKAREDKIEWTAVINGSFYDWCLGYGMFGADVKKSTFTLTDGGKTKFSTTTLPQVGETVAAALKHADQTKNADVLIESFEISQLDILAALEKATGAKYTVDQQDGQQLISQSQEAVKNGNYMGNFGLIQAVMFVEGYGGSHHAQAINWRAKLGLKPLNLQEETDKAVKHILGGGQ